MNTKTLIGLFITLVFAAGAGYIVYMGRPVMKIEPSSSTSTTTLPATTPSPTTGTSMTAPSNGEIPTTPIVKPTSTKETGTKPSKATSTPVVTPTPTPTPEPTPAPNTFTMADVQAHNSSESCWSTIQGNVYDLTTWISRHPGGSRSIQSLCGTDGTARFEAQHGSSRGPRAALVLLKIGTLR